MHKKPATQEEINKINNEWRIKEMKRILNLINRNKDKILNNYCNVPMKIQ